MHTRPEFEGATTEKFVVLNLRLGAQRAEIGEGWGTAKCLYSTFIEVGRATTPVKPRNKSKLGRGEEPLEQDPLSAGKSQKGKQKKNWGVSIF